MIFLIQNASLRGHKSTKYCISTNLTRQKNIRKARKTRASTVKLYIHYKENCALQSYDSSINVKFLIWFCSIFTTKPQRICIRQKLEPSSIRKKFPFHVKKPWAWPACKLKCLVIKNSNVLRLSVKNSTNQERTIKTVLQN